ncbi:putative porin [bacterium]|nr:putative porin [bacterium]
MYGGIFNGAVVAATLCIVLSVLAASQIQAQEVAGSDELTSLVKEQAEAGKPGEAVVVQLPVSDEQDQSESGLEGSAGVSPPNGKGGGRDARPTRAGWKANWWRHGEFFGELKFRYTETFPVDRRAEPEPSALYMTEFDRDLALVFSYEAEPRDGWKARLALKSARPGRPTSKWINTVELDNEHWLVLREYSIRQERKLGKEGRVRSQVGRFAYPFDLTQMVFDNDLHMSGGYVQYEWQPKKAGTLSRARWSLMGAELLGSRDAEHGPARLVSARLDARFEDDDETRVDAALSYHDFTNVDTIGSAVFNGDWGVGGVAGRGETTNYTGEDGKLISDYNIAGAWMQADFFRDSPWPLGLEWELARNLGARGEGAGADDALYAGLRLGRRGEPGRWQAGVDHVRVEADAVLAAVNRGEYGSNYRGTRLQARFTPVEGVEWRATYTWSSNLHDLGDGLAFDDEELRLYVTYSW